MYVQDKKESGYVPQKYQIKVIREHNKVLVTFSTFTSDYMA